VPDSNLEQIFITGVPSYYLNRGQPYVTPRPTPPPAPRPPPPYRPPPPPPPAGGVITIPVIVPFNPIPALPPPPEEIVISAPRPVVISPGDPGYGPTRFSPGGQQPYNPYQDRFASSYHGKVSKQRRKNYARKVKLRKVISSTEKGLLRNILEGLGGLFPKLALDLIDLAIAPTASLLTAALFPTALASRLLDESAHGPVPLPIVPGRIPSPVNYSGLQPIALSTHQLPLQSVTSVGSATVTSTVGTSLELASLSVPALRLQSPTVAGGITQLADAVGLGQPSLINWMAPGLVGLGTATSSGGRPSLGDRNPPSLTRQPYPRAPRAQPAPPEPAPNVRPDPGSGLPGPTTGGLTGPKPVVLPWAQSQAQTQAAAQPKAEKAGDCPPCNPAAEEAKKKKKKKQKEDRTDCRRGVYVQGKRNISYHPTGKTFKCQ